MLRLLLRLLGRKQRKDLFPVIRVFVSSTFRDMQSERDELIRYVFPRLNREFRSNGVRIDAVDLRWGVLDGDPVVDVCRDLIDEADIFVGLLAERYGWVPDGQSSSITADEIIYGVLDNPSMHNAACFLFREPASSRRVPEAEARGFAEPIGSKAHQNLLDLKDRIRSAFPGVHCYTATWNEEMSRFEELGGFSAAAYEVLRQILSNKVGTRSAARDDQNDLDDRLHDFRVWEHASNFIADGLHDEIKEVDAFVWSQFDLKEPISPDPQHQQEIEELAALRVSQSLESFRDVEQENANADGPCAKMTPEEQRKRFIRIAGVSGPPGSGRTALLAHLARRYQGRSDLRVVSHFVGASEQSTIYQSLFRRLLRKIGVSTPQNIHPRSVEHSLVQEIERTLANKTKGKPVLFLLDDVDSLEKRADMNAIHPRNFVSSEWLAGESAAIVSYDGGSNIQANHIFGPRISLPQLQLDQRKRFIEQFLKKHGKRLSDAHLERLAAKEDAGLPAYLQAALSELTSFGSYEGLERFLEELPATIDSLFDFIVARLCENPIFVDASGRPVPRRFAPLALGLLTATHGGLSTPELISLVLEREADLDPDRNVPALVQTLQIYLQPRGERHFLSNGFLRDAIARASENDPQFGGCDVHAQLGDFFLRAHAQGPSSHRLRREVLHSLIASRRLEDAVEFFLPLSREAAARQTFRLAYSFLRMSAQEEEAKMVNDVLSNWTVGNWHPLPATHLQNGGAQADYLEVYQYPCCKSYALCEYIHPPQFISSGCRAKEISAEYQAAKDDAISKIFLSDAAIDQVLQGLL